MDDTSYRKLAENPLECAAFRSRPPRRCQTMALSIAHRPAADKANLQFAAAAAAPGGGSGCESLSKG
jgi:hypothetical protein